MIKKILIINFCLLFYFSNFAINKENDTLKTKPSFFIESIIGYGIAKNSGPYIAFSGEVIKNHWNYQTMFSFFRYDYLGKNISNYSFLGSMNNISFLVGYSLNANKKILIKPYIGLFAGNGRIKYYKKEVENYSYINYLNNLIIVNHEIDKSIYEYELIGGVNVKFSASFKLSEKMYLSNNISTIFYNIGNENFTYNGFLTISIKFKLK
ncbi:MAG: hypothetical protein Kow0079_15010 [Vicingaceae bacterium]